MSDFKLVYLKHVQLMYWFVKVWVRYFILSFFSIYFLFTAFLWAICAFLCISPQFFIVFLSAFFQILSQAVVLGMELYIPNTVYLCQHFMISRSLNSLYFPLPSLIYNVIVLNIPSYREPYHSVLYFLLQHNLEN